MSHVLNDTHLTKSAAITERLFNVKVPLFPLRVNTRKTIRRENLKAEFICDSENSPFPSMGHRQVLSVNLVYMFAFGI